MLTLIMEKIKIEMLQLIQNKQHLKLIQKRKKKHRQKNKQPQYLVLKMKQQLRIQAMEIHNQEE